MSDGKIVKHSKSAIERDYYDNDKQEFSYIMEHKELGFRLPYSDDYKDDVARIVTAILPEYDMILWRILPEITFFRYVRPVIVNFDFWIGQMGMPEAEIVEHCDQPDSGDKPDFIRFYSRFSLGKDWKQVYLKIGDRNG